MGSVGAYQGYADPRMISGRTPPDRHQVTPARTVVSRGHAASMTKLLNSRAWLLIICSSCCYITTAESINISAYALKRLVNHKMNNDVTAGYIVNNVERLREPMQRIASYLLKCMEVRPSVEVVSLNRNTS